MKKVFWSILVLALCLSQVAGFASEAFEEKHFSVEAAQISQIDLDLRDRKVVVTKSADDQIHIRYAESESEFYRMENDGGCLMVSSESNRKWYQFFGLQAPVSDRTVTLELPLGMAGSIRISTTNEDISVSSLFVDGSVSLSVNGGSIVFDTLRAGGAISLSAKNGGIQGAIWGRYEEYSIDCTIKKGNSNLASHPREDGTPLVLSANNGDITIEFQHP